MSKHPMSASADYENMLSAVQASGASRRDLSAAQKKIAELEAERDEARNRNASVELEAVGYSNRMHEALARAEAVEQALTAERHRRESAETDRRELLMMLAGRPDITWLFGFKEKQLFEAARERNNVTRYPNASDPEERGGE